MAQERGLLHVYDWSAEEALQRYQDFAPNYPPFIFILYPFAYLLMKLQCWPSWPSFGANLFFRVPILVGHLLVCFALKQFIPQVNNQKTYNLWLFLLVLNPALLIGGPIWGQLNFLLWGVIALACFYWQKDHPNRAGFFTAIGALIKPQFIMFLPLLGTLLLSERKPGKAARCVFSFFATLCCFCLPFLLSSGLDCLTHGYIRVSGGQYALADIGYNFWWVLIKGLGISTGDTLFLGLPTRTIALLFPNVLLAMLSVVFIFFPGRGHWISFGTFSLLLLFCFLPGMNAHCLILGVSFLCLQTVFSPSLLPSALILSFVQILNLAYNALFTPHTRFYFSLPPWVGKAIGILSFFLILSAALIILLHAFRKPMNKS